MLKFWKFKKAMQSKPYNANIKGWLMIKSDRINRRMEDYKLVVSKQNSTIDIKDFNRFVKSMQIMIAQELTYQKYLKETEEKKC